MVSRMLFLDVATRLQDTLEGRHPATGNLKTLEFYITEHEARELVEFIREHSGK